jgi:hypothetical protein|eukprot:evm.model.NODE_7276_length_5868_cov_44.254089.1
MDKGREGLLEDEDEATVEEVTEAEAEKAQEDASLSSRRGGPSCFLPTMAAPTSPLAQVEKEPEFVCYGGGSVLVEGVCRGRATEHDAIAGPGALEKAEGVGKKCGRLSPDWHTAVHMSTKNGAAAWLGPKERHKGD